MSIFWSANAERLSSGVDTCSSSFAVSSQAVRMAESCILTVRAKYSTIAVTSPSFSIFSPSTMRLQKDSLGYHPVRVPTSCRAKLTVSPSQETIAFLFSDCELETCGTAI